MRKYYEEEFKMKNFWKDYWELCKDTGKFYKKHWKGVVLLNATVVAAELAYFYYKGKQFENLLKDVDEENEAQ